MINRDRERGINNAELPDCERYDVVLDESGKVLCIGTDFHWQEYWYSLKNGQTAVHGHIAKYLHPIGETLSRLIIRAQKTFDFGQIDSYDAADNYQDVISHLKTLSNSKLNQSVEDPVSKITSANLFQYSTEFAPENERWNNFLRSHVPYVSNGYILPKMVTREVTYALL
jgi:hypothetical protein